MVKRGSTGPDVRKLQRALNAALHQGPRITGYFGPGTTDAVKRYQSRVKHARTGVVTGRTWRALSQGRLGKHALKKHAKHVAMKHHAKKPHHKKKRSHKR